MASVSLTIDKRKVEVEAGATVLEAAKKIGIKIPTLCAWTEIGHTPGACRVCVVEVDGQRSLVASCVFPVAPGMVVHTNTERVRAARKMVVELLLVESPDRVQLLHTKRQLRTPEGSRGRGSKRSEVPRASV